MKKYIYIVSLFVFSCGGSSGDDDASGPEPEPVNVAPTVPDLVYPTNGLLCIDNLVGFSWNASADANGDAIDYVIEVSISNDFSTLEFVSSGSSVSKTFTLEKGVAYYWRVKATDSKGASSAYSSTYNLYTEGEGESNHLPFAPELINPLLDANEQEGSVALSWSASDVDGDSLTFDVYFDTTNPPNILVSENQTETTFSVTTVASADYFWRIVVKDEGGQTTGQVWNFSTN